METAFYKLISQIHDKVQSGFFNECLEQFNYFGSTKIRQQALQSSNISILGLEYNQTINQNGTKPRENKLRASHNGAISAREDGAGGRIHLIDKDEDP